MKLCPFSTGTVLWSGKGGAPTLTVGVKGTFMLAPGAEARIASEQDELGGDEPTSAATDASLRRAGDLAPFKPRADLLVVGHAYAREPTEALVARFAVGDLSKAVGVVGDRVWTLGSDGLEPGSPAPFTQMPIVYERAQRTFENPAGLDLTRPPDLGALALPNLESVDDQNESSSLGFGPIAPSWPQRSALLDERGARWLEDPTRPLPDDFDFGFFNAAPRDQQIDILRNGARLVLEHLNREHERLETRLPFIRPKVYLLARAARHPVEIAMRCDTLCIDTDRAALVLVWRGLTTIDRLEDVDGAKLVVAAETKGHELRWRQIERMLEAGPEASLGAADDPLSRRYSGARKQAPDETTRTTDRDHTPTPGSGSWPRVVESWNERSPREGDPMSRAAATLDHAETTTDSSPPPGEGDEP